MSSADKDSKLRKMFKLSLSFDLPWKRRPMVLERADTPDTQDDSEDEDIDVLFENGSDGECRSSISCSFVCVTFVWIQCSHTKYLMYLISV